MNTPRSYVTKTGRIITRITPIKLLPGDVISVTNSYGVVEYQATLSKILFSGVREAMGSRRRYWHKERKMDKSQDAPDEELRIKADAEISKILFVISTYFGIPKDNLLEKTRKREIIDARHMATAIVKAKLKKKWKLSLAYIGQKIGGKDHATVLHAEQKCLNLRETNPAFRAMYEYVEGLIDKELKV